jgi:hypothetical protein
VAQLTLAADVTKMVFEQGDQIGRIFAFWVIVFFGQLFENFQSSANFRAFFHGSIYVIIWA